MVLTRPTLAAVYRAHFRDVARWVRLIGVPERDVEAVAQDVFAEVHASLDRYDPTRRLPAWLRAIAARTAIDHLRSSRHLRESPTDLEEDMMPADTRPDPESHARLVDAQRILIELLDGLSDDLRAVFVMHEIEQLTIPSIAEALGIKENTVRSRLHRARQAFDEAYAKRGGRLGEMPVIAPLALLDAGRAPFPDVDAAMAARVWSRLARLFGLGIVGALAPLPGAKIAAGAALIFVLGGGAGAAMTHALESPPSPPPLAHVEGLLPSPEPAVPLAASVDVTANATSAPPPASTTHFEDAGTPEQPETLQLEQAYLERAWRLLQSGDTAGALRELGSHEERHPAGMLANRRRRLQQQILDDLAARDGGRR